MSKGKYDKISNYNLSYENLLEAVAEFEGYISGITNNDIFLFTHTRGEYETIRRKLDKNKDRLLEFFIKNISSRILDRTTGTYFFDDMFNGRVYDTYFQLITGQDDIEVVGAAAEPAKVNIERVFSKSKGLGKYLHIIGPVGDNNVLNSSNNNAFQNCVPMILTEGKSLNMSETIRYYDVKKVDDSI